jgi:hypothetical protein
MSEQFLNDKDEQVLDFDYFIGKIDSDDLLLTVVKGLLLVEQRLHGLADSIFASPKYLEWEVSKLGFGQLTWVVRAALSGHSNEDGWKLISKLNNVRNQYAHKLEPPDLEKHLRNLFDADKKFNNGVDSVGTDVERVRLAAKHCYEFVLKLDFQSTSSKP